MALPSSASLQLIPKDFKLHSPAGAEPILYTWPLQTGTGSDKHDSGLDIVDTIKWVCEDMPEIKSAMEETQMHDIDTSCYMTMKTICDRFNKAIDSVAALVSVLSHLQRITV